MRLIDRLVLKDLVGPFFNGLFMFVMLVFAAGTLFQATEWIVQGVPALIVGRLVIYSLPSIITQVFPMAMLLAGLLGFGRLSSDRETVAVFAAGITFMRAARAVILMGLLVSVVAFFWNDLVVPAASTAFWDLRLEAFKGLEKSDRPLAWAVDASDNKGVEEYVTVNGGFDSHTRTLRRVHILRFSSDPARRGQPDLSLYCDHARFDDAKGLKATYFDGYVTPFTPDKKSGRREAFVTAYFQEISLLPEGVTLGKSLEEVMQADVNDSNRKSFRSLQHEIQRERKSGKFSKETLGKQVDLYGKIALPIASLIFGLMGAALGCSTQRGGGKTVGFGIAIFIVFLYWMFFHSMFVVGKNGGLPPMLASFLPDIVGTVAAVALAFKASR